MKVLVTGGSGFIGSHLVEALVKRGHETRCLVRKTSNVEHLRKLGVELTYGDITWPESLDKALDGVDIVYHLAGVLGQWGVPDKVYRDVHVTGTQNMLQACLRHDIQRFIYCSSAGVTGPASSLPQDESFPYNPSNIYEATKAEAERLVLKYYREKGLPVIVIRPEFVYGPGDSHVLHFFRAIQRGRFAIISNGQSWLHPTYIDDVIQGFLLCLENDEAVGETYLIVGETPVKVSQLVTMIAQELGISAPRIHIPLWLSRVGASFSELLARLFKVQPPLTQSQVEFFTKHRAFDSAKARANLGYHPITSKEGIRRTITWYQQRGWLPGRMQTGLSFRRAYLLAVVEGEGLGTAYEYIVKRDLITKVFTQSGCPRSILVAGLPEKYGFSMDFVSIAGRLGAEIVIADEREEKLESFSQRFSKVKELGLLSNLRLNIALISDWCNVSLERTFDLIISCEVLQRMSQVMRAKYLRQLAGMADTLVFFAPNAENTAHAKISKLRTLRLDELTDLSKSFNLELLASGYIDVPPFPPGLKRKKKENGDNRFNPVFNILVIWAALERFIPKMIVKQQSHMVYIAAKRGR